MDKLYHLSVNVGLALTGFISYPFALGLCIGASFGKEVGDKLAKGKDWRWQDSAGDLIADAIGMGIGLVVVMIFRGK